MIAVRPVITLLLALVLAAGARAEEAPVVLTADLRAAVAGLESIVGPAPQFDGGPVVVTFFASWCPPCRDEFRQLAQVLDDAATADTAVIAINWHEDFGVAPSGRLERFLNLAHPRMSVVRGSADVIAAFGGVPRIPSLWIFDAEGRAVHRFAHARGATKTHATAAEVRAALLAAGA